MPNLHSIDKFRAWCHKVLPLVYDDSLSYYEFLCKIQKKLNEVIDTVNEQNEYIVEKINEEIEAAKAHIDELVEQGIEDAKEGIDEKISDGLAVAKEDMQEQYDAFVASVEEIVGTFEARVSALEEKIPNVTAADNGKIIKVINGEWTLVEDNNILPAIFTVSCSAGFTDVTGITYAGAKEVIDNGQCPAIDLTLGGAVVGVIPFVYFDKSTVGQSRNIRFDTRISGKPYFICYEDGTFSGGTNP